MKAVSRKDEYEIQKQITAKMFREDKRFRTRIIPNKKKESVNKGIDSGSDKI